MKRLPTLFWHWKMQGKNGLPTQGHWKDDGNAFWNLQNTRFGVSSCTKSTFHQRQTNHWGGWRWIIEVHKSVWHEFQQPFVELYYSTAHLNHRGKSWTAAKTLWSHLSGMCLADGSASSQIWLWDHDHRDTVYIMIYVYIYIYVMII